jgi:hypothetical protein
LNLTCRFLHILLCHMLYFCIRSYSVCKKLIYFSVVYNTSAQFNNCMRTNGRMSQTGRLPKNNLWQYDEHLNYLTMDYKDHLSDGYLFGYQWFKPISSQLCSVSHYATYGRMPQIGRLPKNNLWQYDEHLGHLNMNQRTSIVPMTNT